MAKDPYRGRPHAYANARASYGRLQSELARRAIPGLRNRKARKLRAENNRRHMAASAHWPSVYV
ncbi:MAG: hypothetical protein KGL39_31030 [Patescibacteria group bacterium]|nr:hypothetical protein [Patescibacteria group bacterium]